VFHDEKLRKKQEEEKNLKGRRSGSHSTEGMKEVLFGEVQSKQVTTYLIYIYLFSYLIWTLINT
jgi:hypothetical protein